jgi:hypothetical protein
MTHAGLISTAVLLGLFVLAGGGYGILYGAGMLRASVRLERAAYLCYATQAAVAVAVCLSSPLNPLWKLFIAASCIAYGFIPPLTWRLLEAMHHPTVR